MVRRRKEKISAIEETCLKIGIWAKDTHVFIYVIIYNTYSMLDEDTNEARGTSFTALHP